MRSRRRCLTSMSGAASIRHKMSKQPDPPSPRQPLPPQAYSGSRLDRAAACRSDGSKLAALAEHRGVGVYVIGGEVVVLKAHGAALDPLFSPAEARALRRGGRNRVSRPFG